MTKMDLALALLRITTGASLAYHGYNKVKGAGGLQGTASWFASIGMKFPQLQARLAASTEIIAGILLVFGLFTIPASAALIALMIVAIVTVHWKVGYFIFLPNGGWEYCACLAVIGSVIGLMGPGSFSIDDVVGIADMTGGWAVLIGVVAAVCHLTLTFRRPQTTSQS